MIPVARIDTVRDTILHVEVLTAEPEMEVEEDSDWTFDDEDFWEAIDIMEGTCKLLSAVLFRVEMSAFSRHMIEQQRDELMQFVAEFKPQQVEEAS